MYDIQVKKIDELTSRQMYKILALRFNTFVLEQRSFYNEFDENDFDAYHLFIDNKGEIIAYARAFQIDKNKATFGRVVVSKEYRGKLLGKMIVKKTLDVIKGIEKITIIEIEAQEYLRSFYESFGFVKTSEPFDDGGVMHITMVLKIR